MSSEKPSFLSTEHGYSLACHQLQGSAPGIIFLGGFRSDMEGSKALRLQQHCMEQGYGYIRFDYSGHGQSGGTFTEGTIGSWAQDALAILDQLTEGPQILIGSSMGGWIMLLAALQRSERIAGLIGIAAAPDFTETLMWDAFSDDQKQKLKDNGLIHLPSDYDEPYPVTRSLIEEGRTQLLLKGDIPLTCPVRLMHGMQDTAVPWQTASGLADCLTSDDVSIHYIRDGDHRLSREEDLQLLCKTLDRLVNLYNHSFSLNKFNQQSI